MPAHYLKQHFSQLILRDYVDFSADLYYRALIAGSHAHQQAHESPCFLWKSSDYSKDLLRPCGLLGTDRSRRPSGPTLASRF
jgi:hypothetical protein